MIDNWSPSSFHGYGMRPSSPYSSRSSTHSSHLSILSTTSSVSSELSSRSTSSEHADQPSPSSSEEQSFSSGSKTNAFFASPFSSSPPLPSVPLSAPPASSSSCINSDMEVTPRLEFARAPTSRKSLNDSFFSPSWPGGPLSSSAIEVQSSRSDVLPLPPPPPSAPAATARLPLPPLSRLFPSRIRYSTIDALPSREGSPQGLHTHLVASPPRPTIGRRQLLDLDSSEYQLHPDLSSPEPVFPSHSPPTRSPRALNVSIPLSMANTERALPSVDTSNYPTPVAEPKRQVRQIVASPLSMTSPVSLPAPKLRPGDVIAEPVPVSDSEFGILSKPTLQLVLVRTLGQGAFSSVWLARDESGEVGKLEVVRKSSLKRQQSKRGSLKRSGTGSLKRRADRTSESSDDGTNGSERSVDGTVPKVLLPSESPSDGHLNMERTITSCVTRNTAAHPGRLVALKMTDKSLCDRDDRTRVSFIREVEVLKHISHPSIVSYIHAFSTSTHHILVLEHISGGELFDLVSSQQTHSHLDEPLLRRIFGELCRAVSWMHSVGLVHRDIKLENILLTRDAFADPTSQSPLIKLTDFGLSRFIDPAAPMLTTRCGSESYAAPELVIGRLYDGRETDAWACGVVLYALVTRRLPFDAMNPAPDHVLRPGDKDTDQGESKKVRGPRKDEKSERRALLMRIAKGEYSWPSTTGSSKDGGSLRGLYLAQSEGIRRIIDRLLVRDPKKRARVAQLWEDAWMSGEGAPPAPVLPPDNSESVTYGEPQNNADAPLSSSVTHAWDPTSDGSDSGWDDLDDDEGVLVVDHDIGPGSVVRQELTP